ncbi:hypothetical protein MMC18_003976 [Xylographa bjoerkii]|nr:hypothetical protein [Xylographa bjoerkii]
MPPEHHDRFRGNAPFPPEIVRRASQELEVFCELLRREGIQVYRANEVDWLDAQGYTGSMPRDALLVVGNTIIESCFAWRCRASEVEAAWGQLLSQLAGNPTVRVVRAPPIWDPMSIYADTTTSTASSQWAINNSRPAFDAADFLRFGKTIIAQLSHVTNEKGLQYVRDHLPQGYMVEILRVTDKHAMHIDATLLPLRNGLLIYNPDRVTLDSLRKHAVFSDWELVPFPFVRQVKIREAQQGSIPRFMTSAWLVINVLVLGKNRVVVEELDHEFASWLEARGMTVFRLPFRHVHAMGGSFHCATVDLFRTSS